MRDLLPIFRCTSYLGEFAFAVVDPPLLPTFLQVTCLELEECFANASAQRINGGMAMNDVTVSLLNMMKTLLAFVECSLHKSTPSSSSNTTRSPTLVPSSNSSQPLATHLAPIQVLMWMVRRDDEYDLVHIDAIIHAAHLIGIAGDSAIPHGLLPSHTIDVFKTFYVNKFIDYHTFELAF